MMCFSKYLPTEIPKLNICIRIFGGIIRFFMNIQIKAHYVTFAQVCLLWWNVMTDTCQYNINFPAVKAGAANKLDTKMGQDTGDLMQFLGIIWFCMHIFGGMIRSMVYIEPYYDIPVDPDVPEWKTLLCVLCGP